MDESFGRDGPGVTPQSFVLTGRGVQSANQGFAIWKRLTTGPVPTRVAFVRMGAPYRACGRPPRWAPPRAARARGAAISAPSIPWWRRSAVRSGGRLSRVIDSAPMGVTPWCHLERGTDERTPSGEGVDRWDSCGPAGGGERQAGRVGSRHSIPRWVSPRACIARAARSSGSPT